METRSARKKPTIELRYYELPEHEPVLTLTGEDWVRPYGDTMDNLHFHNLMEVGICRWGEGQMVLDEQVVPYQAGVITLIPANCVHTTVSRDGALNYWEYMFFDPKEILRRAFPENELFAEAVARIDGLSEIGIFFRMYMPIMKSTYAAAAVITFMNAWNAYLWPKVVITDNRAQTMPMLIANLSAGYNIDYGVLMMGVLFCSIPTMIVFFVLQKQFAEGITGAVK